MPVTAPPLDLHAYKVSVRRLSLQTMNMMAPQVSQATRIPIKNLVPPVISRSICLPGSAHTFTCEKLRPYLFPFRLKFLALKSGETLRGLAQEIPSIKPSRVIIRFIRLVPLLSENVDRPGFHLKGNPLALGSGRQVHEIGTKLMIYMCPPRLTLENGAGRLVSCDYAQFGSVRRPVRAGVGRPSVARGRKRVRGSRTVGVKGIESVA